MSGPPPPPPPAPGAAKKKAGDWRKTYKPPSTEEQFLSFARSIFGDDTPVWKLRVLVEPKSPCGFMGLGNQGATCYMNSLLQALYMTPEFRTALFSWEYDPHIDATEERCIPLQLQKLFAGMQMRTCKAINTQALTASFGWDRNDGFQQNDVQELCRILFDVLDRTFPLKGRTSPTQLFQGMTESYITCKGCEAFHGRPESFLDLCVPVEGCSSLYEGLDAFVTPEVLDGANKYACEACAPTLQVAHKGVRFTRLPYILAIQLGRFTFDYERMRKRKLNHEVSFPQWLYASRYIIGDRPTDSPLPSIDAPAPGPNDANVYELLGVLVHAGSAEGGHYYCYCKDKAAVDAEHEWVHMNDTGTAASSWKNVTETFGKKLDAGAPPPLASTSAYMLVYRLVGPENVGPPSHTLLPQAVRDEMERENAEHAKLLAEYELKKELLSLKIIYNEDVHPLELNRKVTVADATTAAQQALIPSVARDCVRLRNFHPTQRVALEAFQGREDATLESLGWFSGQYLLLETRDPNEEFPASEAFTLRAALLSPNADGTVATQASVSLNWSFHDPAQAAKLTVGDLKGKLAEKLGIAAAAVRFGFVLQDRMQIVPSASAADGATLLSKAGVSEGSTVYVQSTEGGASDVIERWMDEHVNAISLRFNAPGAEEAVHTVKIDRRKSLKALKGEIGRVIGLAEDEFRLKRRRTAPEWKDERVTLEASEIFEGSRLYVEKGRPMREGDVLLVVWEYRPDAEDRNEEAFVHRTDIIAAGSSPLTDVRQQIVEALNAASDGDKWDANLTRLREKLGNKAITIFCANDKPFAENLPALYQKRDTVDIVAEKVAVPDTIKPGEMLLTVVAWSEKTQTTGDRRDVTVAAGATKADLQRLLHDTLGVDNCATSKVYLRRHLKEPATLATLNWDVVDESVLSQSPWYLRDGDVLLYRDNAEAEESIRARDAAFMKATGIPHHRPERALKIHVQTADEKAAAIKAVEDKAGPSDSS